jgi:hypothetical protein
MALNDDLEKGNKLLSERLKINEDIVDDLRDYTNLLQDQLKNVKFQSQEKKEILSSTRKINSIAQQNYTILEKELGTEKLLKKIGDDKLKLEKEIKRLNNLKSKTLVDDKRLQSEITSNVQSQIKNTENLLNQLKGVEQTTQSISQNLGVKTFSALKDISKAIPGLRKFNEPFEKAAESSRQIAARNKIASTVSLKTGKGLNEETIKSLGLADKLKDKNGEILTGTSAAARIRKLGLKGALKPQNALVSGTKTLFKELNSGNLVLLGFVKGLFQADNITGDLAKNMNMSYGEARKLTRELAVQAENSGNTFVTTKGLSESLTSINSTLGTNVKLNGKNLEFFTEMRKSAGFTNDELMGMQSLANATGGDLETMTGEFMAQVKLSNVKNKVALNEKTLMKEIGSISAATTLSYGKDVKLLGNAVATTKALGMEMSKVEGIADSLLSFETSISNELEAELLIGRELNLEKARELALNNDIAGVASEIATQMGSSAEFTTLNRIQQEALAKAVGMNREDLARTLLLQEQIGNVSKEDYALREKQVKQLEAEGLTQAQVKERLAKTSIEDLKNQASAQETLTASVDKMKEIFVQVGSVVLPLFEGFASLVGYITQSKAAMFGLKVALTAIAAKSLITAVAQIFAGNAKFGPLGIISAGIGVGALMGAISSAKSIGDGAFGADGSTQISTKEGGLFEISPNDDVVVAPGAIDKMNQPGGGNNQSGVISELRKQNSILMQILQKDTNIEIDGTILNKKVQQSLSTLG